MTVFNWENNRTTPNLLVIPRIITFLGYAPYQAGKLLPEKVVSCRRLLELTQKQMAKMIGVDAVTLCKFERGKGRQMERTLEKIKRFLIE